MKERFHAILLSVLTFYLLKDGPNLGSQSMEIHKAVQQFMFCCWLTTHDRALKDALILYARLLLNLTRVSRDESFLVEQLLDIVYKELDQSYTFCSSVPWIDATKDEKFGALSGSQYGFVELAAAVFYWGLGRRKVLVTLASLHNASPLPRAMIST